jgi:hypothetical protein
MTMEMTMRDSDLALALTTLSSLGKELSPAQVEMEYQIQLGKIEGYQNPQQKP